MSDEDNLRRTVGDIEIARIRALAHGESPLRKDHRDYLDLPPGSGTTVHVSPGRIRSFFRKIFPWL